MVLSFHVNMQYEMIKQKIRNFEYILMAIN